MAITVEAFHDVAVLRDRSPDWQRELRRLVLSDDLLTLPAQVTAAQAWSDEQFAALRVADQRLARRLHDLAAQAHGQLILPPGRGRAGAAVCGTNPRLVRRARVEAAASSCGGGLGFQRRRHHRRRHVGRGGGQRDPPPRCDRARPRRSARGVAGRGSVPHSQRARGGTGGPTGLSLEPGGGVVGPRPREND